MQNTTEILLRDGHFYRRTTTHQDLGAQERILASFAESTPSFIRNYQMIGSQPVHLLASKTSFVITTELTKLPFDSNWYYNLDTLTLIPAYNGTMNGSVQINEPWVPPAAFGKLIFAVVFALSENGTVSRKNTYLYRYNKNELHWFPYPNLFEDCRVCMGRDYENAVSRAPSSSDALSIFLKAHTSFYETKLNSDLTKPGTPAMFSRNTEGEWNYLENYDRLSTLASSAHMRGFAL